MKRKRRKIILSVAMVLLLLAIVISFVLLYIYTDMFKSKATLFSKYIGQNIEKLEGWYEEEPNKEQRKYTTETQIKINYTENVGTPSESKQNPINFLQLKMEGQIDESKPYHDENIYLFNHDKKIAKMEYIQNQNTYGIKFSDLFNQYTLVDKENLPEVLTQIGFTEEEFIHIPDKTEWKKISTELFSFSEEEKEILQEKYVNPIISNMSKENFSYQKNQMIEIEDKKINTNAYMLTLTKEQLNTMYLNMLEKVKQEEIFLTRIDKIQTQLEQYHLEKATDLKEQFITKIEEKITEITRNNIGQDECKIIVYENNHITVRTKVQSPEYEICLDQLTDDEESYRQIFYQNNQKEKQWQFVSKCRKGEKSFYGKEIEQGNEKEYGLSINEKIEENHKINNIHLQYQNNTNKIEANIEQKRMEMEHLEEIKLDETNSISLDTLEEEQFKAVCNKVREGVENKIKEITTNVIKEEDLMSILEAIGIVQKNEFIQTAGITETERNRFNSRFEILQGEKLSGDDVLALMEAIKENLIEINVISDTELVLTLDRLNKNEEITKQLTSFIQNNKSKNYSAKIQYNKETGLVDSILLTLLEQTP